MSRFFLFCLILFVGALSLGPIACLRDEPSPAANQIDFDRYDKDSRYHMTSTAFYCTTSAQFNYAMHNHSAGDIIYLTNSDTLFKSYQDGDEDYLYVHLRGQIIGTDEDQSKIQIINKLLNSVALIVRWASDAKVQNIRLDHYQILTYEDLELDDTYCLYGGYLKYMRVDLASIPPDSVFLDAKNLPGLSVYYGYNNRDDAKVENCSWYDADGVCDNSLIAGGSGNITEIVSWIYEDTLYSYEDQSISKIGSWWNTSTDSVIFTACSSEYNSSAILYYNYVGCDSAFNSASSGGYNCGATGYTGCQYGSYHWIKIAVPSGTQRIYHKWSSTLCDSAVWTSCSMRSRPRNPDGDPPPNPGQG